MNTGHMPRESHFASLGRRCSSGARLHVLLPRLSLSERNEGPTARSLVLNEVSGIFRL